MITVLTLGVFKAHIFVNGLGGQPGALAEVWSVGRWVVALVAVTVSLDLLYYLAPNARMPFKWITPGGFIATALMFALSVVLSLYVANIGNYGRIYGHLGAVVVLMVWLYVTALTMLLGIEINAVLALMAEEKKDVELVEDKAPEDHDDA